MLVEPLYTDQVPAKLDKAQAALAATGLKVINKAIIKCLKFMEVSYLADMVIL
ncbi:hypothetical protein CRENPOLYSF1_1580004 [Crenothrix polyspora]|uniref:Uncharacterized protein n=1 Tax=Crenothrix polyspora TaxID=360316 RepID=A0A1R4H3I5_9GAMM|nr:hypothetical protein CRENPOLYSF1_1580004 [Crenothrix polyspora]